MSIIEITGRNVPEVYLEGLWKFGTFAEEEHSRNGKVLVMPEPCVLTVEFPDERVLTDPVRDANPFFHAMEFVWMMAGSNDAKWLSMFNKRMMEYADDGILRGAYGWRWQNPADQIPGIVKLLRENPFTRQAVLSMWDPVYDGPNARTSDRPCNTHIYFRVRDTDDLEMTVCNRSNDFVWGAMGANAVHMTMLHELVARLSVYKLGRYRVFTNNLHIYKDLPRFDEIYGAKTPHNIYQGENLCHPFPLLNSHETFKDFRQDCKDLLEGCFRHYKTEWMSHVGWPIYNAYLDFENREDWLGQIAADDWRRACTEWAKRRSKERRQRTIN